jgi:hypothetical protein
MPAHNAPDRGITLPAGEFHSNDLQHINVKLLLKNPQNLDVDLEPVIPVFHSWIQGQVCEELLLDVADYRHVCCGPGIVLIGYQGDYSLDNTDNRLGVRYNRKAVFNGSNQDRLAQAARAALSACQRLEEDRRLNGKLHFNGQEIEIFVDDRLLAPNREETQEAVRPEFQAFSDRLFRGSEYSLSFAADLRRLLTVFLKPSRPFAVQELLENLAS